MNAPAFKDYLGSEDRRNRTHAKLYQELLRRAFGKDAAVFVGHHLGFELDGDIDTENEIPSADCLLFDHEAMFRIFGEQRGRDVMARLAQVPCTEREALVASEIGFNLNA